MSLLSLPMSLRKTVMVLYKLEKATAEDLAKETKRLRAVESASANQLVRMGYLRKRREGREVYFYIESPDGDEKMKEKAISIHSSRGGTGKTMIATNLAAIYASKGLNVALLDLDFRAPSLADVFSKGIRDPVRHWLNDFLDGRCKAEQVLIDVSEAYHLKGKLLLGLANPAIEAIRNMMEKEQSLGSDGCKETFFLTLYAF